MQCVQSHRADVVSSSSSRPRPLSEMFMSNGDMPTAADVSTSTSKQPFNSDSVSTDNAVGLACVYLFIPGAALWTFPWRCTVDIPPAVHCGHGCTVDISPEVHCGHSPGGALWTFPRLGMFKRDNLLASCDMSAYSQFVSQVLRCTVCQLCWCCCLSVNAATTNIFY